MPLQYTFNISNIQIVVFQLLWPPLNEFYMLCPSILHGVAAAKTVTAFLSPMVSLRTYTLRRVRLKKQESASYSVVAVFIFASCPLLEALSQQA